MYSKTLLKKEITKQELFDHVCEHLAKQQKPSKTKEGHCAYRGLNSTACAIGACISDSDYNEEIEGLTVFQLIQNYFPEADHLKDVALDLQEAHDSNTSYRIEGLKQQLYDIAKARKLHSDKIDLIKKWVV